MCVIVWSERECGEVRIVWYLREGGWKEEEGRRKERKAETRDE